MVLVSLCGRFVTVLVCGRFGLWSFWFVAVLDVRHLETDVRDGGFL